MKLDRAYERIRIFGLEHEHNYRQKLGITTEFYDFSEALQFKNFADGKYYQPEIVSPETGERIGNKRVNKCYPGFKANPQTLTCEPQRDESAPEPQTSIFRPESIFKKMGGRSDATSHAVTPTAEDLPDTTIKRIDITNWESVKTPGARKSMFDRILELDGKEQLKAALEVTSTLEEAKEFIKARQREADSPNERSVKIKNDFAYQGKSLKWYAHDRGSDISPQHLFTVQKFWGEPKLFPDNIYFITKDKFVIDKLNGSLIYRGVMDSDGKPKYRDEQGVLRSDDQYNACPIGRNNGSEFSDNSEECKIVYEETNTGRGLKADINKQLKDKEISQDHQEFIDSQTQPENQNINLDALKKFIIEEIKYNRGADNIRRSRLKEVYGKKTSYLEAAFKSFIGEKSGNKNVELTYPGSIVDKDYSDVFGENTNPLKVFTNFGRVLGFLGLRKMYVEVETGLYIKISSPSGNKARLDYVKAAKGLIVSKKFVDDILKAKQSSNLPTTEKNKSLFVTAYIQDLLRLSNEQIPSWGKIEMIKQSIKNFLKGKVNTGSEFDAESKVSKQKAFSRWGSSFLLSSHTIKKILRSKEAKDKQYNNKVLSPMIEMLQAFITQGKNRILFTREEIQELAKDENSKLTGEQLGRTYSSSSAALKSVAGIALQVEMKDNLGAIPKDIKDKFKSKDNGVSEELFNEEEFSVYRNPKEDILGGKKWKKRFVDSLDSLLDGVFYHLTEEDIGSLPAFKDIKTKILPEDRENDTNFISVKTRTIKRIKRSLNKLNRKSTPDEINTVFSRCIYDLNNAGISVGLSDISEMHAICLAAADSNTQAIIVPEDPNFRAFDFFKVLTTTVDVLDYEIYGSKITVQTFKKDIESVSVKMEKGNYASGIEGFSGIGLTPDLNPLTPRILPSDKETNNPINNRRITDKTDLDTLKEYINPFKKVLNGTSKEKILGFDDIGKFLDTSELDKDTRAILIELTEQNLDNPKLQEEFLSEAQNTKEPRFFDDFLTKSFTMAAASLLRSRTNLTQMELEYGQITSSQSKVSPKIIKSTPREKPEATMQINENEEIKRAIEESTTPQEAEAKLTELQIKIEGQKQWNFKF